jgi:PAS domain S-box-containing protein
METGEAFFGRELPVTLARTPGAKPEERIIDLVYVPLKDADGTCTGVLGHGTDVTEHVRERRRVEEALQAASEEAHRRAREAEEREQILLAMMEHIQMGITIAEAPDVRIRMVSRFGRELLRKEHQEIAGIPAEEHPEKWQVYHSDGQTRAAADELPLTRATVNGEIVRQEEWVVTRSDGKRIPILCTAAPIRDAKGQIVGGVIGWQDITAVVGHHREPG